MTNNISDYQELPLRTRKRIHNQIENNPNNIKKMEDFEKLAYDMSQSTTGGQYNVFFRNIKTLEENPEQGTYLLYPVLVETRYRAIWEGRDIKSELKPNTIKNTAGRNFKTGYNDVLENKYDLVLINNQEGQGKSKPAVRTYLITRNYGLSPYDGVNNKPLTVPFTISTAKDEINFGWNPINNVPYSVDYGKGSSHTLVAGQSGSGKSVGMVYAVKQMLESGGKVFLMEKGEGNHGALDYIGLYEDYKDDGFVYYTNMNEVLKSKERAVNFLLMMMTLVQEQSIKNNQDPNCGRLFLVIDEFESFCSEMKKNYKEVFDSLGGFLAFLAKIGRSARTTLFIGTQKPNTQALKETNVLSQLDHKFLGKGCQKGASAIKNAGIESHYLPETGKTNFMFKKAIGGAQQTWARFPLLKEVDHAGDGFVNKYGANKTDLALKIKEETGDWHYSTQRIVDQIDDSIKYVKNNGSIEDKSKILEKGPELIDLAIKKQSAIKDENNPFSGLDFNSQEPKRQAIIDELKKQENYFQFITYLYILSVGLDKTIKTLKAKKLVEEIVPDTQKTLEEKLYAKKIKNKSGIKDYGFKNNIDRQLFNLYSPTFPVPNSEVENIIENFLKVRLSPKQYNIEHKNEEVEPSEIVACLEGQGASFDYELKEEILAQVFHKTYTQNEYKNIQDIAKKPLGEFTDLENIEKQPSVKKDDKEKDLKEIKNSINELKDKDNSDNPRKQIPDISSLDNVMKEKVQDLSDNDVSQGVDLGDLD